MQAPSDDEFDATISKALDSLPKKYTTRMDNVAIVIADDPSPDQRTKLKLRCNQTLFGLYEGVPLSKRGSNYTWVLPDKITLFKNPLVSVSRDMNDFYKHVRHTLWHEMSHHFGLDHEQIHRLDGTIEDTIKEG